MMLEGKFFVLFLSEGVCCFIFNLNFDQVQNNFEEFLFYIYYEDFSGFYYNLLIFFEQFFKFYMEYWVRVQVEMLCWYCIDMCLEWEFNGVIIWYGIVFDVFE